jgi:hypothetical protein
MTWNAPSSDRAASKDKILEILKERQWRMKGRHKRMKGRERREIQIW